MTRKSIAILAVFILISLVFLALAGGYTVIKSIYKLKYEEFIEEYSSEYGIDPYSVAAIIWTESKYNPKAISSAGAMGLMQIMPETGEWIAEKLDIADFNADMLLEPELNIRMGCWYLKNLEKLFSEQNTIYAAYNAGPTRVTDWLGNTDYSIDGINLLNIPFEETEQYVERISKAYEVYKLFYKL